MPKKATAKPPIPVEPQTTRGHKKKARTRQALIDAAMRIYAKKSVGELALNELAEEAEVSNGTVYNYFRTREDVMEAVGLELANQMSQRVSALSLGIENGAQRTIVGARIFIQQARQNPRWASAVVRVYQYDKSLRSLVALNLRNDIRLGKEQGFFRYANEEIAMGMVAFTTMGTITAILDGYDSPDIDIEVAKMLLMALGMTETKASRMASQPLPEPAPVSSATPEPARKRGRPRKT